MATQIPPPKLGPKLQPDDVNPATGVTLIDPRDDAEDGDWGANIQADGLTLDFDPVIILDPGTRAHLLHTKQSIETGRDPGTGAAVKPLKERALNEPNRESDHRAFKSGELADHIKRTAIKSSGGTATCRAVSPPSRVPYVSKELKRGFRILTGEGKAREAFMTAAHAAVAAMMTGCQVERTAGETESGKVKS